MQDGSLLISILAALASTFSAVLGAMAGGGIVLILLPLLVILLPGASYLSVLGITKISALAMMGMGSHIHLKRQHIHKGLFAVLLIAGLLGTTVGTYLVQVSLSEVWIHRLLALTLFSTAAYLWKKGELGHSLFHRERKLTSRVLIQSGLVIFGISVLNGMFGGGALFLTIYLVVGLRMAFLEAVAYSFLSLLLLNLAQTGYLIATQSIDPGLAFVVSIGGGLGAWLGTHLQYKKSNRWVRNAAILVMVVVGIQTLLV